MKRIFLFFLMTVLITGFAFSEITISSTGSYNEDQTYNLDPAVDLSLSFGDFTFSAGTTYSLPDRALGWSAGLDYSKNFLSLGVSYSGTPESLLDSIGGVIGIDLILTEGLCFYGETAFSFLAEEIWDGADLGISLDIGNFSALLGYQFKSYVVNSVYEVPGAYFSASFSF